MLILCRNRRRCLGDKELKTIGEFKKTLFTLIRQTDREVSRSLPAEQYLAAQYQVTNIGPKIYLGFIEITFACSWITGAAAQADHKSVKIRPFVLGSSYEL